MNKICSAKQKKILVVVYNFGCEAKGLMTVGKELT